MGITFISCIGYTTYDYYIKQRLPICKIKLNQLLHKNPKLYNCLDRFTICFFFKNVLTFQLKKVKIPHNSFPSDVMNRFF